MTIREFCKFKGITLQQLAKEIGYSHGTMKNASSGQMKPGLKMILRLQKATGGKVTMKDLRPELFS